MSVNNPTCPTGCTDYLQNVSFDLCNPAVEFGEIDHIYLMSQNGDSLANWELLSVWQARLAPALDPTSDYNAIIDLHVIADLPVAEQEELTISLARKIQTPATFLINFEIDDLSEENYDFMRWLECNFLVTMWFSANEVLFGGNDGIDVTFKAKPQIERGQKSLQKIVGSVSWESKFSPERCVNPMA